MKQIKSFCRRICALHLGLIVMAFMTSVDMAAAQLSLLLPSHVKTAPAQQSIAVPNQAKSRCGSARTASTRLICADPDLAALDSILVIALHDAHKAATWSDQRILMSDQLTWLKDRDQKCELVGKDQMPLVDLTPAKQCLEDAIEARISELQGTDETATISAPAPPAPTPSGQGIIITPVMQPVASLGSSGSAAIDSQSFEKLHFSAPAQGIEGSIDCSALPSQEVSDSVANTPTAGKPIVRIAIDNNDSSYRMFETDTWAPFLDNLRAAVYASCGSAIKSGRLHDLANDPVIELTDVFEVYSSQGLFTAFSVGANNSWNLQSNLPKTRKVVKSNLGIQAWVNPSQLNRNPYFFKDSIVGMVIQFDRMVSESEAVFRRSGDEIFVSGVAPNLFQDKETIVLAGRVNGNKGLISPMGSETLLPALSYIGSYKCGDKCAVF
jgi:uncharacterized protein YecT (DUF1311 family)